MTSAAPPDENRSAAGAAALKGDVLALTGDWNISNALKLDRQLRALKFPAGAVKFDLAGLGRFDTTGAWLLDRTRAAVEKGGGTVSLQGGSDDQMSLLEAVQKAEPKPDPRRGRPPNPLIVMLSRAGGAMVHLKDGARDAIGFMGLVIYTFARTALKPVRLRFTSLVHHIEETGLNAVPIVMLMSFLIGAVLAYQGSEQLQRFGAQIFTVDLIGISFLREIGILLTAILVAGRSGSAFTAQIGSMKMREEIDAMRTLGLDPVEMLIVPRILALVITLPLLGFLAGIAGLIGGGVVAVAALDISPIMYVERLQQVVEPRHFWVGIIKAPVFAFLIGAIGCFEGLRVTGSAESVGQRTTQSVVEGIFVVIIADALFSILFVNLGW